MALRTSSAGFDPDSSAGQYACRSPFPSPEKLGRRIRRGQRSNGNSLYVGAHDLVILVSSSRTSAAAGTLERRGAACGPLKRADLIERQWIHLEATRLTRHQHAVEFGVMQRLHDWVCEMTFLLTAVRVFSDQGGQPLHSREQLLTRNVASHAKPSPRVGGRPHITEPVDLRMLANAGVSRRWSRRSAVPRCSPVPADV
jgi:hypothetical protein